MPPKFLLFILLFSISSFALTLDQVRADLKLSALSQDSVEMSIRTTVNTPAGKQVVSIYMVQKGSSKTYTEMKTSFMNQRSNGNLKRFIFENLAATHRAGSSFNFARTSSTCEVSFLPSLGLAQIFLTKAIF